MKRVKYANIDRVKWGQMLNASPQNNLFCQSWYLDICAEKWDALIWGDYEAGFPLPISITAGVEFLHLPFFVRQLNILGKSDNGKWNQLLTYIQKEFKRVDISISHEANSAEEGLPTNVHQELNLSEGYDSVSSSYSNNAKRLIKKCKNQALHINEEASPKVLIDHFKRETGQKIKTLGAPQYQTLLKLMEFCLENDHGACMSVKKDGELLGAAFFMTHDKRVTFLKSYTSETGKKMGVSYYLMDHAIQHYAKDFIIFDFGGSKVESVAQFYKKFGAIDAFYLHLSFDNSPVYHKLMRGVKRKIKG